MSGNPNHPFDVAVIGAGPAGSCAAYDLARGGMSAVVLEQAEPPRYKTCGGGVVGRALRMLPFAVDEAVEVSCPTAEMNLLDSGLHYVVQRDRPIACMTMRSAFDALLLSKATAAGAVLHSGRRVERIEERDSGVCISTTQGEFTARFVVIAAGAAERLARQAGWREPLLCIPALEWELHVDPTTHARFQNRPRFDFETVPAGYAWLFPKRDHLSVGALSFNGSQANLKRALEAYLQRLGLDGAPAERHGFVIPVRPRREGVARSRILLAGDAAGLADPLPCEGISFAIRSGRLAAKAIRDTIAKPQRTAAVYQYSVGAEILGELRLARLLSAFLYHRPRLRRAFFRRHGQSFCEAMTEVMTGRRTYRELLLSPRNALRLLAEWLS